MTRFRYKEGFLWCKSCQKQYKKEDCPYYQSKVQRYQICPECPQKYRLRTKAHNKNSHKYYVEVTKKSIENNRDIIVLYKRKLKTDPPSTSSNN